jgi:hypothetical protein
VGGVFRFTDGREVQDHVYASWDYPGGRTSSFSSIESNAFEGTYEAFFGTKATLIMSSEREAYLFEEKASGGGVSPEAVAAALEAPATAAAQAIGWSDAARSEEGGGRRVTSSGLEISTFCSAVRSGRPLSCGPTKAMGSARACIRANEAAQKKTPRAV